MLIALTGYFLGGNIS